MLVLAAAAGMLVSRLPRPPVQISAALPAIAGAAAAVPAEPAPVVHTGTAAVPVLAAKVVAEVQAAKPEESMQPAASSFTVLVQPLQIETSDPAVESRVQEYFNALLDELRAVPGLVLVRPDATGATPTPTDLRITVSGGDSRNSEFLQGVTMYQVAMRTEVWRDNAYRQETRGSMEAGGTLDLGGCQQGSGQPKCGPVRDAAVAVAALMRVFPLQSRAR